MYLLSISVLSHDLVVSVKNAMETLFCFKINVLVRVHISTLYYLGYYYWTLMFLYM